MFLLSVSINISGPTKDDWRSDLEEDRRGSPRITRIAGNSIQKRMAINFLKHRDRSNAEGIPENNGDHFGGEI